MAQGRLLQFKKMIAKAFSEPYTFATADNLEELTGADLIISPLQAPITFAILPLHIKAGALLVQIKRGLDLASSLGSHLWESLAKMRETGARQWQCVLLTTGVVLPAQDDRCIIAKPTVHIDGHVTWEYFPAINGASYQSVESALRHWTWYGGVVVQLADESRVEAWARLTESRLLEKIERGVKEIWPSPPEFDDPLIGLQRIRDWRTILAAFPGVGPAKATSLRQAMLEAGTRDTLVEALRWITSGLARQKAPGWGKGLEAKIRNVLGLNENEQIIAGGKQ